MFVTPTSYHPHLQLVSEHRVAAVTWSFLKISIIHFIFLISRRLSVLRYDGLTKSGTLSWSHIRSTQHGRVLFLVLAVSKTLVSRHILLPSYCFLSGNRRLIFFCPSFYVLASSPCGHILESRSRMTTSNQRSFRGNQSKMFTPRWPPNYHRAE